MSNYKLNMLLVVVFLIVMQLLLLLLKCCGVNLSWVWVFTPMWSSTFVFFVIPILFSVVSKIINFIKSKRNVEN